MHRSYGNGHGENHPRRRQPSTRKRFGCCRICQGRIETADQLTCSDCGVCVHRSCATNRPVQLDDTRWLCACCSLSFDETANDNSNNNKRHFPSCSTDGDDEQQGSKKRTRLSETDEADDDSQTASCPICHQPLDSATAKPETCNHVFCYACLMRWRASSAVCPMDRVPFDTMLVSPGSGQPSIRLPAPPVAIEQPVDTSENLDIEFGTCVVCRMFYRPEPQFDDMVECDHCQSCYHMHCLGPELGHQLAGTLAEGQAWYCDDCRLHVDGNNAATTAEPANNVGGGSDNETDGEDDDDNDADAVGGNSDDEEDEDYDVDEDDEEDDDEDEEYNLFGHVMRNNTNNSNSLNCRY